MKVCRCWYVIEDNIGEKLCIDEKNINSNVYTIVSNPDLNKMVAIIPWIIASKVIMMLKKWICNDKRIQVQQIASDMSNSMKLIAKELFLQAKHVTDRFHVMKNVLEDLQAIRIRIKTLIKKEELTLQDIAKKEGKEYNPKRYANWETRIEFTTRLRYQLFKRKKDWNYNQIQRWEILCSNSEYDDIKYWYDIISSLFIIYDETGSVKESKDAFYKWFEKVSRYHMITEMQNAWRLVLNNLEWILNYFISRHSNWYAEWLHSRIWRLISNSRWFKNEEYMVYKIVQIFG